MRSVLLLILFIVSFIASAQLKYQKIAGFEYAESIKGNANASNQLPVLIAFHFSSSRPSEAIEEYDSLKFPVRIIAPKGNFRKEGGYSYFPSEYYSKDSLTQMALSKQTLDSVAAFVKAIGQKYKTKPIVAGFSQGGDLSFLLAIYYPQLIKAAFPFAGFVHRQRWEDVKKHAQKSVPVYIYQGDVDKIISVNFSRKEVRELKSYFNITLTTYPGLGHDYSPEMMRDYSAMMKKILK